MHIFFIYISCLHCVGMFTGGILRKFYFYSFQRIFGLFMTKNNEKKNIFKRILYSGFRRKRNGMKKTTSKMKNELGVDVQMGIKKLERFSHNIVIIVLRFAIYSRVKTVELTFTRSTNVFHMIYVLIISV